MLTAGLVSVTFRQLSRSEIAEVMKKSAITAIEWGADIHVPPNDTAAADDAAEICRTNGIVTASYGSYYRCSANEDEMDAVIASAVRLGTGHIRVWAGSKGSADADDRADTVRNLKTFAKKSAAHGIRVSPEFHGGTLTDHYESAVRLAEEVAEDNLSLYWQPNQFRDDDYNRAALRAVLPYLSNVHVFTWDSKAWYPLADGERMWREYIDIISSSGRDHNLLMEFVVGHSPDQFARDAETLKNWIRDKR